MIKVANIYKRINGIDILNDISLTVPSNKITVLTGLSGSGKSVLLKIIVGLMHPDSGKILIEGRSITDLKGIQLMKIRQKIGFLFQNGALFDSLTVFENVAFPVNEHLLLDRKETELKVMNTLKEVDLSDAADKLPSELSGGMNKRAALARALVLDPDYLLLDEPTTGLDPVTTNVIHALIKKISDRGVTILMISHNIQAVSKIADFIVMICTGRIMEYNSTTGFIESKNPIVRQFVNGDRVGPIVDGCVSGRP